ncbi:MAG: hypothetical protein ACI4I6_05990 [Hominimerdicola sp.]
MKNKTNNTSARKKLVPAIAMLTTSAIMLSSVTYAWFTMNKEVEVQGIEMTATTSNSLEISLGAVTKGTNALSVATTPGDTETEISWTNIVNVAEYYDFIGKIKPSSTNDCSAMYDATDATNGGQLASVFTTATNGANVLTARSEFTKSGTLTAPTDGDGADKTGYYIDIPVHLRTSKIKSGGTTTANILCAMDIKDKAGTATGDGDLYKAVRVAFINDANKNQQVDADEVVSGGSGSIWGVNSTYYHDGGVSAVDASGNGTFTATTVQTDRTGANNINIPIDLATTSGTYGHADFIMRIWLEGESTYCLDKNAAQDWQIDLKFALEGEAEGTFVQATWKDANADKTRDEVEATP